jgi:hypothetical protein
MKTSIEIGDEVNLYIGDHMINGIVLYMPCATGDCWHIDSAKEGIVYIQNFNYVQLNEPYHHNE